MFKEIMNNTTQKSPLIHNITNYVTVNDCANVVLAAGGSPLMSDDIDEVKEIISISSALVINIGTLNRRTINSMIAAGEKANEIKIPVVLDPVGMGASSLRNETTRTLLSKIKFSVIKGNISEIKAMVNNCKNLGGVDVQESDIVNINNIDETISFAKKVAVQFDCVIAITGKIDIIANSTKSIIVKNGHPMMSRITGTGCMCGALIGTHCGGNPETIFDATVTAITTIGLAGEIAFKQIEAENRGTGSFRITLIDSINLMTPKKLQEGAKIENR